MNHKYKGIITALITPFINNEIDYEAFSNLIDTQINNNINGIVIAGTTGESSSLSMKEKIKLLQNAQSIVNKRMPIIIGINSNSLTETIKQMEQLKGADAFLIPTPYYIKPTQDGIYQYYASITQQNDNDIIIYNVPSRTMINITTETLHKICKLPKVVAIKDAVSDIWRAALLKKHNIPLLSGDDQSFLGYIAYGGSGVISVISNLIPKEMSEIYNYWINKKYEYAMQEVQKISHIINIMGIETNPIPIKYAMSYIYKNIKNEIRPPMTPLSIEQSILLKKELNNYLNIVK